MEPLTLQWCGLGEFSVLLRDAGFPRVTVHAGCQAGQRPADGGRVWAIEAACDWDFSLALAGTPGQRESL